MRNERKNSTNNNSHRQTTRHQQWMKRKEEMIKKKVPTVTIYPNWIWWRKWIICVLDAVARLCTFFSSCFIYLFFPLLLLFLLLFKFLLQPSWRTQYRAASKKKNYIKSRKFCNTIPSSTPLRPGQVEYFTVTKTTKNHNNGIAQAIKHITTCVPYTLSSSHSIF